MTVAALGVTLLVTASVGLVVYGLSLYRLLTHPRRRGLVRTATCRVAAALLYGAIAVATLLGRGLADVTALAVFIAVQLVWMANSVADVRLTRLSRAGTGRRLMADKIMASPERPVRVLDRRPLFDPRNLKYPVRALLPRQIERRTKVWATVDPDLPLNQGAEGACVGFGWSGELAASPVNYDVDNASARQLYEAARGEDRAMGHHWPEGASVLGGARAAKKAGKVSEFRWALGIDDLIDTLVVGGPVVLGVDWYRSMYRTDAAGGVIVDTASGRVGGHCLLAIGYHRAHRTHGECIEWLNSWGPDYGIHGRGFIPLERMAWLLAQGGDACIATDVLLNPPPPAPKPPPRPWWRWW